jgi:two-component system KDP operon response regulator KdpE
MRKHKVLIIDENPHVRRALKARLERSSYEVLLADRAEEALDVAALQSPDLVLLDTALHGLDGFRVCQQLREWSTVPIIVISARNEENDKILALDLGADDYLTKPFGMGELLARLRAVLRRAEFRGKEPSSYFSDGLLIDYARRIVTRDGIELHLTPKEYELLRFMATNAGRVLSHEQLLAAVWNEEALGSYHPIRQHVLNLRMKIEPNPEAPIFILTETRVGYRFRASSSGSVATHTVGHPQVVS